MPIVIASKAAPPPPPAPAASPEDALIQSTLSSYEQAYFRGMKKRDRNGIRKMLGQSITSRRGAATTPLRIRVLQSALPDAIRLKIFEELRTATCNKYLQWVRKVLELPLNIHSPTPYPRGTSLSGAIERARAAMDATVTGFEQVKKEVLKMVCQMHAGGAGAPAYSLALEGAPGTGKTHFAKSALATALGRPIVSIPLAGATDLSFLLGNVYVYEGSKEGRLAAGLVEAGCSDPDFLP